MNYAIGITDIDASKTVHWMDGEPESEFMERMEKAKDKSFFRLLIQDQTDGTRPKQIKQFALNSPYFLTVDKKASMDVLKAALKQAYTAIDAHEEKREPAPEKSLIILPGN